MSDREIIVELTGPLERAVGRTEVPVHCPGELRLGAILARLVEQHPETSPLLGDAAGFMRPDGEFPPGILVIRDSQTIPARLETPVAAGDRLTLMPLISGG